MKKLLAIICVLLIIFLSMYGYKSSKGKSNVTVAEVQQIEEYLNQIYLWKEVTNEALPKFDCINNAPDLWVWEVVNKNLEEFELDYNQIQDKATEMFGTHFEKKFPAEGSEYLQYNENLKKYVATGIGLDTEEDLFFIKEIKKTREGYEVEIAEYLEDYVNSQSVGENGTYDVYIKNLNEETISTIKSDESDTKTIESVKENIDKFSTKKITLEKDENGKIYIEKVE